MISRSRCSTSSAYLDDDLPEGHPFAQVKAQPAGDTSPQIWLLGSSDYSGALAAQLGLRFAFAHFISARGGDVVMRDYKTELPAVAARTRTAGAGVRVRDLRRDPGRRPSGWRRASTCAG